jgi:hypothetical protein
MQVLFRSAVNCIPVTSNIISAIFVGVLWVYGFSPAPPPHYKNFWDNTESSFPDKFFVRKERCNDEVMFFQEYNLLESLCDNLCFLT